jgi:ABC-2 type transport system ATP-binding protein
MIEAQKLRKAYGSLLAVEDVSLSVPAGATLGLLGPNGAGKSTTISLLTGLLTPDAGTISIAGSPDPRRADARARLGVVPQSLAIYEELTGRENLHFFGRLYGLQGGDLKKKTDQTLDFVGLTDRAHSLVSAYSGGMKRRLNMAAALLHDPQVLLFDEPTVGMDPQSRNLLFERIEALKAQGRTILYTTHYMEEAERLCDRVAIIDHGRILAEGAVEELVRAHGGPARAEIDLECPPPDTASLPGTLDGLRLTFTSDNVFAEIARLVTSGLAIREMRVVRPGLEQVFLNLTGRSLRD